MRAQTRPVSTVPVYVVISPLLRASQDIDTFFILNKNLTPSQAVLDCHKNIYLSLHLRYLDKMWFANRL